MAAVGPALALLRWLPAVVGYVLYATDEAKQAKERHKKARRKKKK